MPASSQGADIGPSSQSTPAKLLAKRAGSTDGHQNGTVERAARSADSAAIRVSIMRDNTDCPGNSASKPKIKRRLSPGGATKNRMKPAAWISTAIQRQRLTASAMVPACDGSASGGGAPKGVLRALAG